MNTETKTDNNKAGNSSHFKDLPADQPRVDYYPTLQYCDPYEGKGGLRKLKGGHPQVRVDFLYNGTF